MIPKQIFYIWFGNNIPNYLYFSMEQCRKINDDYKVDLITYSLDVMNDIKSSNDDLLIRSDEIVQKKHLFLSGKKSYITLMSDTYRMLFLDKYGGFYSDCDIFYIRKIPQNYLTLDKISCTIMYTPYILWPEIGFFGVKSLNNRNKNMQCAYMPPIGGYIQDDNDEYYRNRRQKFFSCTLNDSDYVKFKQSDGLQKFQIAEHFSAHSWHKTDLTNKDLYYKK